MKIPYMFQITIQNILTEVEFNRKHFDTSNVISRFGKKNQRVHKLFVEFPQFILSIKASIYLFTC